MAVGLQTMKMARKLRQTPDFQDHVVLCSHGQVEIDPEIYLGKLNA